MFANIKYISRTPAKSNYKVTDRVSSALIYHGSARGVESKRKEKYDTVAWKSSNATEMFGC